MIDLRVGILIKKFLDVPQLYFLYNMIMFASNANSQKFNDLARCGV